MVKVFKQGACQMVKAFKFYCVCADDPWEGPLKDLMMIEETFRLNRQSWSTLGKIVQDVTMDRTQWICLVCKMRRPEWHPMKGISISVYWGFSHSASLPPPQGRKEWQENVAKRDEIPGEGVTWNVLAYHPGGVAILPSLSWSFVSHSHIQCFLPPWKWRT